MTEWSEFTLNGWTFKAYMPTQDHEVQQWFVHVIDPNKDEHLFYVPMDYAPVFGPDVSDIEALNEAVESFIKERRIE